MATTATLLGPVSAEAGAASPDWHKLWSPPGTALPKTGSVKGSDAPRPAAAKPHYKVPRAWTGPTAGLSQNGAATANLSTSPTFATSQTTQAGHLPVWLTPIATANKPGDRATPPGTASPAAPKNSEVKVTVAAPANARAAGIAGPLITLQRGDASPAGRIAVGIGADQLDVAYGADAATRAHLVTLPACALTTPQVKGCLQQTPVVSHYDVNTRRLVTDVTLPAAQSPITARSTTGTSAPAPLVLAATATPSGGGGTYKASSLTPSAAWSAGSNSGGFGYGYPIPVPSALGGTAPQVALSYNSSSVDGRTSSTNAQASWVGDGWDYSPGFVERSYKACDKAGIPKSGDSCWAGYNASLSLAGHSSELVHDDATGKWRLKNDDGSKVEFLTGAANGTGSGEYIKVSVASGSVYYFGLNHLPGGDKSDPATNSAWTEPVYSPKAGDPCYDAAKGTASWCQMGWRFNLDYAVDSHGNLTTYTYTPETNWYSRGGGQNQGTGTLTSYTRGGVVASIGYGQRLADQVTAKGILKPAAKVIFTPAPEGRCSTAGGFTCTGAVLSAANAAHWPDVPYDQNCPSTGTCTNYGPTFWSNTRLASIATQVLSAGAYKPVDAFTLTHTYPDPADGNKPTLWLAAIQRTGQSSTPAITLPKVTFTPVELPNRVDGTDLVPAPTAFNRPRIQAITTETGEQVVVDYNLPACSRVNKVMPVSADSDTMACYNVKWSPPGSAIGADPISDWFNHYTVKDITESDPVAHATAKVTNYQYGPAAWHRNDSELTDPKSRTWDDFRGFATVTITIGSGQDGPVSQTATKYLQGMDGDATAAGGTKSVQATNSLGEQVTDADWLSGQVLENDTYDRAGGSITSYSVTKATGPSTTGTHVRGSGLPDLVARYNETTTVATSKSLKADGTWRTATTTTRTDPAYANRTVSVLSTADAQPDQCTVSFYAASSNPLETGLVSESRSLSGNNACTATATAANTVTNTRTLYDGQALGQAGITGDASSVQVLDHYDGNGAPVFVTTTTSTYDAYGRIATVTDPNTTDPQHPAGATTSTVYTPAAPGELPSTIKITAPAPGQTTGWTTTSTLDNTRDVALSSTDANGKTTNQAYDGLGRLTRVWQPGRTTSQAANLVYTYAVNGVSAPSTVTTDTLRADGHQYNRSVQLLNGFGQVRQTQDTPGISAYHGRVLTDTLYDSHGRAIETRSPYYDDTSGPATTLFQTTDGQVPGQTSTVYDGQGRPTATVFSSYGVEQSRTTSEYPGLDQINVTPPNGATANTTITDSLGRTSQLWQYKTASATGHAADADITTYTYTPAGNPASRTDATGKNTWTYSYDLRGRQISATDPDTGTTKSSYDTAGRLVTTTDARQQSLTSTFDLIGRTTGTYTGITATPANQLTSATYDSISGAKGHPVASTRYVGGAVTGSAYTSQINSYDVGYQPTSTTVTIPASEDKLAGAYTSEADHDPITGALTYSYAPAMGDVPAESLDYTYDVNGALSSFGSANITYDLSTDYDAFGRALRTTVNPWGTQIVATQNYDQATGRLLSSWLDKQTAANGATQQSTYDYNPAGQLTAVQNIPDNTPAQTDLQCFSYDYLNRLTTAWTDTGGTTSKPQPSTPNVGGCKNTTPTSGATAGATTVGGPSPYWTSYGYDSTGNRTGLTQHDTAGNTSKDITTTQSFAPAGQTNQPTTAPDTGGGTGGPHGLISSTSTGPSNPGSSAYQYDAAGDTTAVTTTAGTTTLKWDSEGKLASATPTGSVGSTYVYDAGGGQLIRRDPGKTTLNLGVDELTLDTTTKQLHDTRTYPLPNGLTAVVQGTTLTWQVSDPHGTAELALDATTLAETRRPTDPFGNPRGTTPTAWAGDHGFVGGTQDLATGLTNLGAREYQPTTGRFLNPDPLLNADTPQQWNGYAYAGNNPTSNSDPSGMLCMRGDCNAPGAGLNGGNGPAPGDKQYDANVSYCSAHNCDNPTRPPTKNDIDALSGSGGGGGGGKKKHSGALGWLSDAGDWVEDHAAPITGVVVEVTTFSVCMGLGAAAAPETAGGTLVAATAVCGGMAADANYLTVEALSGSDKSTSESLQEQAVVITGGALTAGATSAVTQVVLNKLAFREAVTLGCNSFPANVGVLLSDNSREDISAIEIGDRVQATDPLTGTTKPETVTAVTVTQDDKDFTDLTVDAGDNDQTITSTQHHPYWNASRNQWVDAADLRFGETLRQPNGTRLTVKAVRNYHRAIVTYNLTVNQLHTFYVVIGDSSVLVHNCPIDLTPKYTRREYKRPTTGVRLAAIAKSPTCPYCGERPSVEFEHVRPQKEDWDSGGWLSSRDVRSDRVNDPSNTTGACKPCNASKQDKPIGAGPGQWWPPGWTPGVMWPLGGHP
ncbi:polymorphic toxin-type HINT domain-containing protein [Streptomyces sp. RKAG293]|uniref:polymorphic toxin-type HINT domain-containing protein n=1 Tax=Streptomyces sp. RKAG293 TaxID=2893403 RepID=UPI002033BC68|nr:polymorphic toxin-type HINT domain-containing protein [Streptomyces sp. RKAG293]MCM2419875.1 hypothetical protein [Streptomyces sp. RKAG293]